ncbi:ABC transporter ATP-binding protein [Photobacterium kishitanii]|uniref:ABC transporter ATP-binding protein n=1 Tax=Photobacterium kishitanii TaxID=318456 RepID=UPI0005D408C4|nr:ABC transporter ATP-binding protein [Photobacterium kishitanii]KJG08909.1 hypothetical protein UB40_15390 [Photobacterium kishitanii]PSU22076.1 ABC transporter ATP-binding protein [Photobacterium kishitanii]PSV07140.1 ABC transporter ATP-binding protein [Photobacterium kishitanii]PSV71859.1 ABC transporter ATP-binding protein [Photobacterium kishitanii]
MIKVSKISFCYPNRPKNIFDGHSFELDKSEVLAILGPNGSGKTTLIKCLLGLLPISGGEVKTVGKCSYVPQSTSSPFDYCVRDMVVMGASGRNGFFATPSKLDKEKADEALLSVGMLKFANESFCCLSGGQQQMILIARALVSQPNIMILDEPTSALDYFNQNKVLTTIKEVAKKGTAVIFSTHCPQQALHVADKVLLVRREGPSLFGLSKNMLNKDNLRQLYNIDIARGVLQDQEIIAPIFS